MDPNPEQQEISPVNNLSELALAAEQLGEAMDELRRVAESSQKKIRLLDNYPEIIDSLLKTKEWAVGVIVRLEKQEGIDLPTKLPEQDGAKDVAPSKDKLTQISYLAHSLASGLRRLDDMVNEARITNQEKTYSIDLSDVDSYDYQDIGGYLRRMESWARGITRELTEEAN